MVSRLIPYRSRVPNLLDELGRELNNMLGWFDRGENGGETDFVPRLNLAETDKAYEVNVDLPGMKSDDIEVEVKDSHLWITGHRQEEHEEKGKKFHRMEQSYGRFQRMIQLGEAVDADHVSAEYKNGVLHVSIPKTEAATPKRIPVKE